MKFLDNIILDNSVRTILAVFGTIILVLIFRKTISKSVASLLFIFVRRNWKTIEKKEFVALIIKPLAWFISICISVFAIDKLNFPEAWLFKKIGRASCRERVSSPV